MNWSTWAKVARFHLVDRLSYTALPWGVLAFDFACSWPSPPAQIRRLRADPNRRTGRCIYLFFLIAGC